MLIEFMDLYVVCGVAWFIHGLLAWIWNMNLATSPRAVEARRQWSDLKAEVSKSAPHPVAFPVLLVLAWVLSICYLALKSVCWPIDVAMHIKKGSS